MQQVIQDYLPIFKFVHHFLVFSVLIAVSIAIISDWQRGEGRDEPMSWLIALFCLFGLFSEILVLFHL